MSLNLLLVRSYHSSNTHSVKRSDEITMRSALSRLQNAGDNIDLTMTHSLNRHIPTQNVILETYPTLTGNKFKHRRVQPLGDNLLSFLSEFDKRRIP